MNAEVPSVALELQSREFSLVCTRDGTIQDADKRAQHHLDLAEGASLVARAALGGGPKLERMLDEAGPSASAAWEIALAHGDRVRTVRFFTQATGTGPSSTVRLLGSLAADDALEMLHAHAETLDEVVRLNRQVVRQRTEAERLNRELRDSNAGVRALHQALEERLTATAEEASIKSRVVQHISHEFRTPIHSILGMAQLLLSEQDGPLTPEQRTQISHLRTAADDLSLLVSDLLDLGAIEAGAAAVHTSRFSVSQVLEELRGALRPLLPADRPVELEIEDPDEPLMVETDRVKLGQVLRNLVGNALKYTLRGQVTLQVRVAGDQVVFAVEDSGPGIEPDDQARIFEEFVRLPSASHATGTGLGLPVARGLTRLLGGDITLESTPGVGSIFTARISQVHPEAHAARELEARTEVVALEASAGEPVLVVEDDRRTSLVYEQYLSQAGFRVMLAESLPRAEELLQKVRPAAIVLDIMLARDTSWSFLQRLKENPKTATVPVLVVTVRGDAEHARALGADEFWLKPLQPERLIQRLQALRPDPWPARVLVIDDNPRDRYLLRRLLADTPHQVVEASTGEEGVRLARSTHPDVIILDFLLRDETAFDVIDALKSDPATRLVPIIVSTAQQLTPVQRERLTSKVQIVLSKAHLSKELAIHRIRDALHAAGVQPSDDRPERA